MRAIISLVCETAGKELPADRGQSHFQTSNGRALTVVKRQRAMCESDLALVFLVLVLMEFSVNCANMSLEIVDIQIYKNIDKK
jgi:hypothetical protein